MTTVIFRSIRMPARAASIHPHTHIAWRLPATNVGRESKESKQVQNFICKWLKIGVLIRAALHNSQLSARSIEHPIRIHTHILCGISYGLAGIYFIYYYEAVRVIRMIISCMKAFFVDKIAIYALPFCINEWQAFACVVYFPFSPSIIPSSFAR